MYIERKSGDESSHSITSKHYGNHRKSLLYGGFLDSSSTYDQESGEKANTSEDTKELCERQRVVAKVTASKCKDEGVPLTRYIIF